MTNTRGETEILATEAERRVRAGESRAVVARDLGVGLTTMANWALRGRWRQCDLEDEAAADRARIMRDRVIEQRTRELEHARKDAARLAEVVKESMDVQRERSPGPLPDPEPLVTADKPSPDQLSLALAQTLLEQGRIEEAERAARFSMRFAEAQQRVDQRGEQLWKEEREQMRKKMAEWRPDDAREKQWRAHVARLAAELAWSSDRELQLMNSGQCPTCTQYFRYALNSELPHVGPPDVDPVRKPHTTVVVVDDDDDDDACVPPLPPPPPPRLHPDDVGKGIAFEPHDMNLCNLEKFGG
jgi:hypothetical protein